MSRSAKRITRVVIDGDEQRSVAKVVNVALLDFMNRSKVRSMSDEQGSAWQRVGVYLYRADGRYPPATWAETPEQFAQMIPNIRQHVDKRLEVRVTNTHDHLLFHATDNGIEWDGIQLKPLLDHDRNQAVLDGLKKVFKQKSSPDR